MATAWDVTRNEKYSFGAKSLNVFYKHHSGVQSFFNIKQNTLAFAKAHFSVKYFLLLNNRSVPIIQGLEYIGCSVGN